MKTSPIVSRRITGFRPFGFPGPEDGLEPRRAPYADGELEYVLEACHGGDDDEAMHCREETRLRDLLNAEESCSEAISSRRCTRVATIWSGDARGDVVLCMYVRWYVVRRELSTSCGVC